MVMLHFNGRENGHVTEVVINGGSMVIFRGGQYNGGRMFITEVVSLNQGEWSFYRGGQFNGGRMVMLQRWSLQWREKGHQRVSGGQFNGGRIV